MAYTYLTQYDSPNYSAGRPAGPPNAIFIHYWDKPEAKPSFDGTVSWLCRKNGTSSAHYVVEAGKVACIVAPGNRAWHAGSQGNPRGIGIECNPRMSAGDLETVAELIADLRKTYGDLPLKPHNSVMNTSCPGPYVGKLAWLSNRANEIRGGTPTTTSPTTSEEDELNAEEKLMLKEIHAVLTSANGKAMPGRVRTIQDILTGYTGNEYVKKGYSLPLIGARVRDIKDMVSGGGPAGEKGLLREILNQIKGLVK